MGKVFFDFLSSKPDLTRLSNLTHYICFTCDRNELGATKLNKVLWYSDLEAYIKLGQSITGETYIKRQFGPVPKHIQSAIEQLVDEHAIYVRGAEYYGFPKTEYITLTHPNITGFKPDEISIVDTVANWVCRDHTARSISLKSHDVIWELAEIGEEIPLHAVFGADLAEITERDIQWANEVLGKTA